MKEEERRKEEDANKSQDESQSPRPDESGLLNPSQPGISISKESQQKS